MINDFILKSTTFPFGDEYTIKDNVAIHKTAVIGHNVNIKAPAIISENCFVGSNSYLRGGVFLAPGTLLMPRTIVRRLELIEQDPQ